MRIDEGGVAVDHLEVGDAVGHARVPGRPVGVNDVVLLGDKRGEVDPDVRGREPGVARMGRLVDDPGRLDQVLGRQAAPVGAGPT